MSYSNIDKCRFCDSELTDIIHFGDDFPLAGGFLRSEKEFANEKTYPLTLVFCIKCCLLQCKEYIHSDMLFKQGYFYYSSMIPMLRKHFNEYAATLASIYPNTRETTIIEIGCNDGVMLRPLKEHGFNVIGVDPSDTVKECVNNNFTIYNTYFNEETANQIVKDHGQCDVFLSSNSFAHINDMKSIMNGIKLVVKDNGLIIIEVHYSKTIIDELQFDFIYHEHMSYYNVTSFYNISQLFGMSLEDVEFTKIHGTSIRVYLRNTPNLPISDKVRQIIDSEKPYTNLDIYRKFNSDLQKWKNKILTTLQQFQNKKIYGYGSSGRSNIIIRYLDLHLDELIDDAPSKIGSYTPIYHNCIKSSQCIIDNPPDVIIILAWAYSNDIIANLKKIYNGKIIIPMPDITVLDISQ